MAPPSTWQHIPPELIADVAKRCTSIKDYLTIRGVCHNWRSGATFQNFDKKSTRLPLLMHFPPEGEKETKKKEEAQDKEAPEPVINPTRVANFLDLPVRKTCRIPNFPPVNQPRYLSWSGWILCVSDDAYLAHPICPNRIYLPDLGTFPQEEENVEREFIEQDWKGGDPAAVSDKDRKTGLDALYISKMVLSDSPTMKSDPLVMVIWGKNNQLGFCRVGDSSWTVMDSWEVSFSDIIYHNERLYAVDFSRRVVECDIHGPNPTQIQQVFSTPADSPVHRAPPIPETGTYYLVESSGKMMIVCRRIRNEEHTWFFYVYEIDLMDRSLKPIHDLGNRTLFLGSNSSLCVDLSECDGLKFLNPSFNFGDAVMSSCVYFTDHCVKSMGSDTGVFCLSNFHRMRSFSGFFALESSTPLPTWVLPSF